MKETSDHEEAGSSAVAAQPPGYLLVLDYLFIVFKRWPLVVLGLLTGLGVAGLVWKYSERVYESRCALLVERYATPASFGAPVLVLRGDWLATEAQLMSSELVLEKAARMLDGTVPAGELAASLMVENPKGTQLLAVRYQSHDPYLARDCLSAVVEAYKSHFEERTQGYQDRLLEWYQKKEPELRREMIEAEGERLAMQQELGYSALEAPQEAASERIATLSREITKLRIRRAATGARLAALVEIAEDVNPEILLDKFPESGVLATLGRKMLELAGDLAAKEETLGPNHPQVAAVRARMEEIRHQIMDAVPHIEKSLRADLALLDRNIREQQKELTEARTEANEIVGRATRLEKARVREERAKQIYEPYVKRLSELTVTQSFKSGWVQVVNSPKAPLFPRWPSAFRLGFGGIAVGLLLGVLLAMLRENLDDSAKMAEDVLHMWSLPVLGFIPYLENPPSPEQGQELARSGRADVEALRMLAVSLDTLLSRQPDEDDLGKVVVFASPGSREGKTLLTLSTGMMLAHGGRKVLMVDGDFRRRGLTKKVGMSEAPGVNSWFRRRDDISGYIRETGVPSLDVLPAGRWSEGPALMFRQEMLHGLLEDLRRDYRYILVDVPPMTFVSDALTLAGSSAQMVMITRMGATSKRLLRRARHLAETSGINVAGVVINEFDARGVYYGYYYRYYGYYQYYQGYGEESAAPEAEGSGET